MPCNNMEHQWEDEKRRRGLVEMWKCVGPATSRKVICQANVLSIAIGNSVGLFLTEDRLVYTFDPTKDGTPLGSTGFVSVDPVHVSSLKDKGVIQVACGFSHSAVVCENGDLYMWGDNADGQCGVNDESMSTVAVPTLVQLRDFVHTCPLRDALVFVKQKVSQVSCGFKHTVALVQAGHLWMWGSGSARHEKVVFPKSRKVHSVTCGSCHNLAIVSKLDDKAESASVACDEPVPCSFCARINDEASNDELVSLPDHCPLGLALSVGADVMKSKDKSVKDEENSALLSLRLGACVTDSCLSCASGEPSLSSAAISQYHETLASAEICEDVALMEESSSALQKCPDELVCPEECCNAANDVEGSYVVFRRDDEGISSAASFAQQQHFRKSLTESFRHNVGVLDVQAVMNFLSKKLSSVSNSAYQTLSKGPVVASRRDSAASCTVASASPNSAHCKQVEEFRFVSKHDWLAAAASLSRDTRSMPAVELSYLDTKSEDSYDIARVSSDFLSLKSRRTKVGKVSSVEDVDRLARSHLSSLLEFGSCEGLIGSTSAVPWDGEVWCWGEGSHGQLGLGDALPRHSPICIELLNGCYIVKVVAGYFHSMALSASGRVYAWGLNSHGQLGFSTEDKIVYTPTMSNCTAGEEFIQDAAAGHKHSVFLKITQGMQKVYVTGKCERSVENVDVMKTDLLTAHDISFKGGRIRSVFSGTASCGCIADCAMSSGYLSVLYELANMELVFFSQLKEFEESVIEPLSNRDISDVACGVSMQTFVCSFLDLKENAGRNAHFLWQFIQRYSEKASLFALQQLERQYDVYSKYCSSFCDVLAINGFAKCINKAPRSMWRRAKQVFGGAQCEEAVSVQTLQQLMEEPVRHMSQYEKLFTNVVQQRSSMDVRCCWERAAAKKWRKLVDDVSSWKECAEQTRAFWDTCSPKIAEQFGSPSRRFVRDSKSPPLFLQNVGRFAVNYFILFSDIFVHSQYSTVTVYDLALVWVDPAVDLDGDGTAFALTFPEDANLTLVCSTPHEKTEWVRALNDAINAHMLRSRSGTVGKDTVPAVRCNPPLFRHATYTFTKLTSYKNATYTGSWLCGQMQGCGELVWPDGQTYVGNFKQNRQHGYGKLSVCTTEGDTLYEGMWKNGKLHGLGSARFPNGDSFDGYFENGQRNGHGVLKQGQFLSTAASVYIGQWAADHRHGYGVTDDITKGEKHMGMWQEGRRQGRGVVVTLDGLYYEGNFSQNNMTGLGLMYNDGFWYEGEVGPNGTFSGKGLLTLPCGDSIEGVFAGSWDSGIKIGGTYAKAANRKWSNEMMYPKTFGSLCVPADQKWNDIFEHCLGILRVGDKESDFEKAWDSVAVAITNWKKLAKHSNRGQLSHDFDMLERIPRQELGPLSYDKYCEISAYLSKAFESPHHPLGKLMDGLVDVYRATYIGIGTHQCLLSHAVLEVHSFVERIYDVVRILFPVLPTWDAEESVLLTVIDGGSNDDDDQREVVTARGLLLPILLPKIYPPLFTLYALHNEKDDELYWETLLKWNKQSDLSLMAFLEIDQKFWVVAEVKNVDEEASTRPSLVRDSCYLKAIESLQHISTAFCPLEKLRILQNSFEEINIVSRCIIKLMPTEARIAGETFLVDFADEQEVHGILGSNYTWTMDDLFPVFQYVVIRARIRHLGSEIHVIDDLMESRLKNGELGIMFTMLKACFFQVKNEWSMSV